MGQIKFDVPDEVEEDFRRAAMERFGYERGSLTKAGEAALREWADTHETMGSLSVPDSPVAAISGQLADVDTDSVDLQESVGSQMATNYIDDRNERDADEADSEC
ncbi:hypothetical protein OB955_01700 [Halobacteria archaeon AArc-m2/3/4]|uniref:Uncharacterized protein n=1 Tax=Natronoglomus mannanivorans TaxID=2979990 RepID=A0AAP2YVS3_9EURY|nr:hypothetical protein [Halobacteria archaeon AArc-xg1-1]MCU4971455.1 hypothetical protein [Halobacteria archaeon AArc-m2/3/4]